MKQYLVFGGDNYYPNGGWEDFKGAFDELEEAKDFMADLLKVQPVLINGETIPGANGKPYERAKCDWAHIVNLGDGRLA